MFDSSIFYDDYYGARWNTSSGPIVVTWSVVDDFLGLPGGGSVACAGFASQWIHTFETAFALWDAALESISFVRGDLGNSADVTLAITDIDGPNATWGYWNATWDYQSYYAKATIQFDVSDVSAAKLLTTALHEIGNILGLGDIQPSDGFESVLEDPFPKLFSGASLWSFDHDLVRALYGEDTLSGTDDLVVGTSANEVLSAGAGNDVIRPGAGDDQVDGGEGLDTVEYETSRAFCDVALLTSGDIQISGASTGSDLLHEVERVRFSDGALLFDFSSDGDALVYRIYQAAFARTPDEGGFLYWAQTAETLDLSALQLATEFRTAPEFIELYGSNLSDYAYTENMYANVLGRAPDQAGIDYWAGQVSGGVVTRDQLLIEFAVSVENVALTAPNMDTGFWVV